VDFLLLQVGVDVAERFVVALEATLILLAEDPWIGRTCGLEPSVLSVARQWHVQGFDSHLIFYRPRSGGIEVLRILHGARDLPGLLEEP
jgi:toxin ParE1/3/4